MLECHHIDLASGILELKNLAVEPEAQRRGYGKALIDFLVCQYRGSYDFLQVGTGDSPLTVPFYEKCGFTRSHRIPNFFTPVQLRKNRKKASLYKKWGEPTDHAASAKEDIWVLSDQFRLIVDYDDTERIERIKVVSSK